MTTQMILVDGPVTFTEPTSSSREYYTTAENLVDDQIAVVEAYSDPFEGGNTLQSINYIGYTISLAGAVTSSDVFTSGLVASNSQTVPNVALNYEIRTFNSLNSDSVFAEYLSTETSANGPATFDIAVVNLSGGSTVVTPVDSITINPVPKTFADNITAKIANLTENNSLNEQIFEVDNSPGSGQTAGTFLIYNSSGSIIIGPSTGFSFADNKAHIFNDFGWDANDFGELVEVWNAQTGLADMQLSLINATTGAVTPGWIAATEMNSITFISSQTIDPAGGGMIVVAAGTNAGGRGFNVYLVNDSTASSGGSGGDIIKSQSFDYSGTVTQDARIAKSGIADEYLLYWGDGTGLNIELIDANLDVLETYNIPASEANSTATLTQMGNGEIFVSYRFQSSGSSFDSFDILNLQQTAALPVSSGNTDEWIMSGGNWEASAQPGSIPSGYSVAGVGDFTGDGTSDILWYDAATGDTQQWLINNGGWAGTVELGSHPGNYQIAGVGDFTGDGVDDVLWTSNSGGQVQTDIWELNSSGQWQASDSPGSHPAGYNVAAVGDFTGNGTSDILWYNSTTGDVDEWQIAEGQWAASVDLGSHPGSGWTIAGVGDFFGNGNDDVLWTNSSGGSVQTDIWQLGPNGQWEASVSPGTHPAGYQVAGIGDVTGSSVSDIIWYNPTTGDVDEWKIANGQWAGSVDLGTHPGNYQISGMGNFTGDGTSDVLWHSTS
jgi:FG-GAP-like repeat